MTREIKSDKEISRGRPIHIDTLSSLHISRHISRLTAISNYPSTVSISLFCYCPAFLAFPFLGACESAPKTRKSNPHLVFNPEANVVEIPRLWSYRLLHSTNLRYLLPTARKPIPIHANRWRYSLSHFPPTSAVYGSGTGAITLRIKL